jgi:Protein of unknown function (DUF4241)
MNINLSWGEVIGIAVVIGFAFYSPNLGVGSDSYHSSTPVVMPKGKLTISIGDTAKPFPALLELAYDSTTVVQQDGEKYSFYNKEIGQLNISTGKVIAGDPVTLFNAVALKETFSKGFFPVQLSVAKTNTYEIVAFSRIYFSDKPVSHWEFALLPGQVSHALTDSSAYCYTVDAGLGVFIDSAANKALNFLPENELNKALMFANPDIEKVGQVYYFDRYNVAAFTTGGGDGCYSTYIGRDADGNICRLITDFGLFRWWENSDIK